MKGAKLDLGAFIRASIEFSGESIMDFGALGVAKVKAEFNVTLTRGFFAHFPPSRDFPN